MDNNTDTFRFLTATTGEPEPVCSSCFVPPPAAVRIPVAPGSECAACGWTPPARRRRRPRRGFGQITVMDIAGTSGRFTN